MIPKRLKKLPQNMKGSIVTKIDSTSHVLGIGFLLTSSNSTLIAGGTVLGIATLLWSNMKLSSTTSSARIHCSIPCVHTSVSRLMFSRLSSSGEKVPLCLPVSSMKK